jgi:hypothetical protein
MRTSENQYRLEDYLTKRQILKQFRISPSLYKLRLKELKSHQEYCPLTQVVLLEISPFNTRKTPTRIIHKSLLEQFFTRKRSKGTLS